MSAPQKYRIQFDGCGSFGTQYFRIERRGWFGLWWAVQTMLLKEQAKDLISVLRRLDEEGQP